MREAVRREYETLWFSSGVVAGGLLPANTIALSAWRENVHMGQGIIAYGNMSMTGSACQGQHDRRLFDPGKANINSKAGSRVVCLQPYRRTRGPLREHAVLQDGVCELAKLVPRTR